MRFFAGLGAGRLALASMSSAALAQSSTTIPVVNGMGMRTNVAGQQDSSGYFHYRDVMEGLLSGGGPQALTIDSTDSGSWSHVTNWPTSWSVTGTFWPYTLNGDGGVPSHVTNWPATQSVQGMTPAFIASGVTAVPSTIAAAGASSSFTPIAGRTFHVQLSGTASAQCYLERQLDGSTWVPITVTASGTTTIMYNWTYSSVLSEDVIESQASVPYRVDCGAQLGSFTSGSLSVRFSQ
jgi:hypothetical protein